VRSKKVRSEKLEIRYQKFLSNFSDPFIIFYKKIRAALNAALIIYLV